MADVVGPIRTRGGEALAVRTDVTDLASVQALAERAFGAFGRVHVLCNNAGVALWGGLEAATHRDWQWVLGVNLWGVIHGLEAFLPRMLAQKEPAHIVNTASMAGLVATRGLGIYNTSKYAVVGLSAGDSSGWSRRSASGSPDHASLALGPDQRGPRPGRGGVGRVGGAGARHRGRQPPPLPGAACAGPARDRVGRGLARGSARRGRPVAARQTPG